MAFVAERGWASGVLWSGLEGNQEGAEEGDWLGDKWPTGSPQTAGHECEPEVRHWHPFMYFLWDSCNAKIAHGSSAILLPGFRSQAHDPNEPVLIGENAFFWIYPNFGFCFSLFWYTSSHLCMNFMNKARGFFSTWRALLINEIPWIGEGMKSKFKYSLKRHHCSGVKTCPWTTTVYSSNVVGELHTFKNEC